MTPFKALAYFVREAASGLLRGWKSSLLAIVTVAVSLFVWGCFLLAGRNLSAAMESWRSEARVIVYFEPRISEALRRQVEEWVLRAPWVASVEAVSTDEARRRFAAAFPSLADSMEGWTESPLPASLEIALRGAGAEGMALAAGGRGGARGDGGARMDGSRGDGAGVDGAGAAAGIDAWLAELAARPGVDLVDDDRDWLEHLEAFARGARAVGLVAGLILLGAATFTTASVIRLGAFMYQDEISIMRMVGATEFLIRGPFYCEGLLQGGLGAAVASGGLYAVYAALAGRAESLGVVGAALLARFLSPGQLGFLLVIGCLAGTLGAVISLKGEALAEETA